MNSPDNEEMDSISSLDDLEGKIVCWTFFAGRPLRTYEKSYTRHTIQLPDIYKVVHGKLENIFSVEHWIGDSEDPEWQRAESSLIKQHIKQVWSPMKILIGSCLLQTGESPESHVDGEIYRYEGIQDVGGGPSPLNMFNRITVHPFIEKIKQKN